MSRQNFVSGSLPRRQITEVAVITSSLNARVIKTHDDVEIVMEKNTRTILWTNRQYTSLKNSAAMPFRILPRGSIVSLSSATEGMGIYTSFSIIFIIRDFVQKQSRVGKSSPPLALSYTNQYINVGAGERALPTATICIVQFGLATKGRCPILSPAIMTRSMFQTAGYI